jgi:hypothetical protein
MKKLVLTSVCAVAVSGVAFAQGTALWSTISPSGFTSATNSTLSSYMSPGGVAALQGGTIGATTAAVGAFYYELLYSPTTATAPTTKAGLQAWDDTGLEAEDNSASAGRVVVLNSSPDATVPFTGATDIMMVGWSSALGSTWSAAEALLVAGTAPVGSSFGESTVALYTPNASGVSPGATVFGTSPGEIDSLATPLYTVTSTPEPTTIALGVMGGLSLLALRRKKA